MRLIDRLGPIRSAMFGTIAAAFGGQLTLAVSGILAARILGVEDRGHLALLILLPVIVTQLGLALTVAATYYIARDHAGARRIVSSLTVPALAQTAVLTMVHASVLFALLASSKSEVVNAGLVTLLAVPALLSQQYGLAILQGESRFKEFNVLRTMPAVSYATAVLVFFLVGVDGLFAIMAAWVGSIALIGPLTLLIALRRMPASSGETASDAVAPLPSRGEMFRFGGRALLGSAAPAEYFQLDQAVAGLFLSPASLGLYVAGLAFTNLPRFVGTSIGMVAYPSVAGVPQEGRRASVWHFFAIALALNGLIVLALELGIGWLLPLAFGHEFDNAIPLARILLIAALLLSARRVLIDGSRGAGRPALGSVAELVSLGALLIGIAVFAPLFGIEGIAVATLLAATLSLVALIVGLLLEGEVATGIRRIRPQLSGANAYSIVTALVLLVPAGVLATVIGNHLSLSARVLLPIATLILALTPIATRIAYSRLDVFEPILPACLMLAVLFGVRPLWMTATGQDIYELTEFAIAPYLTSAYLIGLIATSAFVVSYEIAASPRRRAAPARRWRRVDISSASILALLGAGLGIFLYCIYLSAAGSVSSGLQLIAGGGSQFAQAALGRSSEYLTGAPILASCGAILLVLAVNGLPNRGQKLAIAALVGVPIVIFLLGGGRRFIIPSLAIPIVAAYLVSGRRPSWRNLAVLMPLLFLVLAIIPFARAQGARQAAGGAAPIFSEGLNNPLETTHEFISGPDTEMVAVLAVEVAVLDRGSYAHGGATVGDFLLAPIPSSLFPNKPMTARDSLLTKIVGTRCDPQAGCPDYTAAGTFYQDVGYAGVPLGMALLGLGSGWLWRRHRAEPRDPWRVLPVACWTVMLPILIRAGFMPGFAWFLYFLMPTWVGMHLAVRRSTVRVAGEETAWVARSSN